MNNGESFSYHTAAVDKTLEVQAIGSINEDFEIPLECIVGFDLVRLDLSQIRTINSEGTRQFRNWLFEIEEKLVGVKVKIIKIQPVVVRQFTMMHNYFNDSVEIESVFVPFYCETCDHDDVDTLVTAKDAAEPAKLTKDKKCSKCGQQLLMDISESYLKIFS